MFCFIKIEIKIQNVCVGRLQYLLWQPTVKPWGRDFRAVCS